MAKCSRAPKKEIDEAIKKQLDSIAHSTLLGAMNIPSIKLAARLIEIAPRSLSRVFYSDSGATSVEIAIKMAYQYWQNEGFTKKTKFVALNNGYHGDTVGAMSVGSIDLYHRVYSKLLLHRIRFLFLLLIIIHQEMQKSRSKNPCKLFVNYSKRKAMRLLAYLWNQSCKALAV